MQSDVADTALPALNLWRTTLVEISDLGAALCEAIDRDELVTAVAAMMQLRRARSAIARVDVPAEIRADTGEVEALAEVRALLAAAQRTDDVMRFWLQRPLPSEARLLADPLGIAVLADAMLPPAWDFETDLIVLVGDELAPVARILTDVGQRRTIWLGTGPAPAHVIAVRSIDELELAIETLVPVPPAQLVLRASVTAAPELVEAAARRAHAALSALRVHRNTVRAFSRTWIEQGMANLEGIARWPSVDAIGNAFAGMPMVIVAPGPSLARNAEQLRSIRGRAVLVAFSHSLKAVLAAGVTPDLVLTVDPQDVRYHFAGCDLSETYLVNAATVHSSLFELPARGILTLSANCTIDDWVFEALDERPSVPGGGSVATTAFSLGVRWRCEPIIFLGLDLSFPGGQYYVSTSSDGDACAKVGADGTISVEGWSAGFTAMKARGGPNAAAERAIELPGWHGTPVPSSFMFGLFHRWFVERVAELSSVSVFNCTEGGAWIEGMRHEPFAEVLAGLTDIVEARAVIDRAICDADVSERARRLSRHLASNASRLRRARKLALRARALIERGGNEAELTRVERGIADVLRPIGFVGLLAQRELEHAHGVAIRAGTSDDFLRASSALFATLIEVVDRLIPMLVAARARLEGARW